MLCKPIREATSYSTAIAVEFRTFIFLKNKSYITFLIVTLVIRHVVETGRKSKRVSPSLIGHFLSSNTSKTYIEKQPIPPALNTK